LVWKAENWLGLERTLRPRGRPKSYVRFCFSGTGGYSFVATSMLAYFTLEDLDSLHVHSIIWAIWPDSREALKIHFRDVTCGNIKPHLNTNTDLFSVARPLKH
jgi:hypothetical protein